MAFNPNNIGIAAGTMAGATAYQGLTNNFNLNTVIGTLRFNKLLPGRSPQDPNFIRPSKDLYKGRGSLSSPDLNVIIPFQFNPTELKISRKNIFEDRSYEGSAFVEPIWVKGEGKTINFTLTFISTAGAQMENVYGGTLPYGTRSSYNDGFSNYDKVYGDLKNTEEASKGNIPIIEAIEALTYPIPSDMSKPMFINSVVNTIVFSRFNPLPRVIFCFGSMYLTVKIEGLEITHKAFNKALFPVISDVDITLKVLEGIILDKPNNPLLDTPIKLGTMNSNPTLNLA